MNDALIGAIAGDIIGSVHEFRGTKTKRFPLFGRGATFTDDTVLLLATAREFRRGGKDYAKALRDAYRAYPHLPYGREFAWWAATGYPTGYRSYGSGAAVRGIAIGSMVGSYRHAIREAADAARVTHDHCAGLRGARAVSACVYEARLGRNKPQLEDLVESFRYNLVYTLPWYRRRLGFQTSCLWTVPPAVACFLEAKGYEDAVRNAASLGGDADTLACIAGGLAGAYYGVPDDIKRTALRRLDARLRGWLAEAEGRT